MCTWALFKVSSHLTHESLYIFHYALFLNGLKKFIVVYDLLAEKYLDCICSVMCTWPLVVYDLLAGNSESGLQSDTSRLMALKPQSILCNCNSNIGISRAPLKNQGTSLFMSIVIILLWLVFNLTLPTLWLLYHGKFLATLADC